MADPVALETIRRLSSGRWLMPILARMSGEDGSRFGSLARTLGLSRSVLSRHLAVLEQFGWIARNPGHGHPLRPEYLLSETGAPIASWCARVMCERARLGLESNALGRWSLPLVWQLQSGWQRFSEIERALSPITARALSLTMLQSIANDLARRSADLRQYGLTARGADLAIILSH